MAAPSDRVQLLKQESTAGGGDSADGEAGFPSELNALEDAPEVQGIFLQPPGGPKDELVYVTRDSVGNLVFKDGIQAEVALSILAAAGSGINESQHEQLDRLSHLINESSFDEYTYAGSKVTNITTWESAAKTTKVREEQYSYSGNRVTQLLTIQYDGAGVEKERNSEVFSYVGSKVQDVTRSHV